MPGEKPSRNGGFVAAVLQDLQPGCRIRSLRRRAKVATYGSDGFVGSSGAGAGAGAGVGSGAGVESGAW